MNQSFWTGSNVNLTTGQDKRLLKLRRLMFYGNICCDSSFKTTNRKLVVAPEGKVKGSPKWSWSILWRPWTPTSNFTANHLIFHSGPMWKTNQTTDTCCVWPTSDTSAVPSADSKVDERDEIRSVKDGGNILCMSLTLLWDPLSLSSRFVWMTVWFSFDLGVFRDACYNSKTNSHERNHQPAQNRSRTSLDN